MKKALLIIAVIVVLSGCGTNDSLTCTTENTLGNVSSSTTYKINYRDNDVKMMTITYEYKNSHTDGVGTGTDGTTEDGDNIGDTDGVIDGVVGEALDDVVTGVTNTILELSNIRTMHNNKFGIYTNTDGFTTSIDMDDDENYKVTYTYDFSKLSDDDISTFGISRNFDTMQSRYTSRGLTCR